MKLANLDRQSVVPLYYQIQQHLLRLIRSGELKSGEAVPSEQEICKRMRVSRMTARQALKSLCSQGIAYSQRGKGTFVSGTKLEMDFRHVLSFSEEMRARGSRPRSRVIVFKRIRPDAHVAEALRLAPEEDVFLLKRVRQADSVLLCVESSHLPFRLFPDLLENFDPGTSLYQTLSSRYRIQIELADEIAEAGLVTAEESRLLGIRTGAPVFRFTRTSYVLSGEPVEFVRSTYRGDRCKVVNRLSRKLGTGSDAKIDVLLTRRSN